MSKQSADNPEHNSRYCSLYLHIPFCIRKCPYCSFFSIAGKKELHDRYARAVIQQLQRFSSPVGEENRIVDTVFFGGGTPTMLAASLLAMILEECKSRFILKKNPEISIEVNPATVNRDDLQQLFQVGFNRISIGAQSLSDADLQVLGRPHTAADVHDVVDMARKAGFFNVSLDLMYGLPGQTVSGWQEVLLEALRLEPDHLSIYELTVEQGTIFAELQEQGKMHLPDEDQVLAMMDLTQLEAAKMGFNRYEISNYALPGKECLHNINYWKNGSYIGVGSGAVSCLSGSRKRAVENVEEYCQKIESGLEPWSGEEELDQEERFRETVIMGLRMTAGVSISDLQDRFGVHLPSYYRAILSDLIDQELIIMEDDHVRLSPRGLLVANRVMAELV